MENTNEVLNEINRIFGLLQSKPWSDHSPAYLSSAQGKLSSYLANITSLSVNAQHRYEMLELNASQFEAEKYIEFRKSGMKGVECEYQVKLELFAKEKTVIDAKRDWLDLKGIVDAIKALSVACSTTLKHYEAERFMANKQGN